MKDIIIIVVLLIVGLWVTFSVESIGTRLNEAIAELFYIKYELNKMRREKIYCKDCKYNNGGRCGWHGGAGYKWIVDDYDFCSCGVRDDDGTERS